eukprot:2059076-Rhodomonas_salina.1
MGRADRLGWDRGRFGTRLWINGGKRCGAGKSEDGDQDGGSAFFGGGSGAARCKIRVGDALADLPPTPTHDAKPIRDYGPRCADCQHCRRTCWTATRVSQT